MAFSYKRTLTFDHTQVGGADQTNFPVLVSSALINFGTTLKTVGNGGHVTNSNGYDIGFYSDSGLTTALFWEIDFYDGAAGTFLAWVRIPTVSSSSDTVIYMGYGDATISTFQSTATTVWSNSFSGVWHLGNGSILSGTDSTTSGNTATVGANAAVAGSINGATSLTSANIAIAETTNGVWNMTDITMSAWVKDTADSKSIFWSQNGTPLYAMIIGDPAGQGATANRLNVYQRKTGAVQVASGTTSVIDGVPHYCVVTRDSATGVSLIYVDGALQTTSSAFETGTLTTGSGGDHHFGTLTGGYLDEARIATAKRPLSWILSEYNSQKTSSTFTTLGAEQANGSTTVYMGNMTISLGLIL